MDPATLSVISAVLSSIDWKAFGKTLATEAASKGGKVLLGHLGPGEREKAAKKAIELFTAEFLIELEDKTPLSLSLPGYQDHLKRLIENAATDIVVWLQPDAGEVDLAPVQRMWGGLGLAPLPEGFDWTLVAKSYGRSIRVYVKSDPALRGALDTALREKQLHLQEQSVELLARIARTQVDFDLEGYRRYLERKCGAVQLSSIGAAAGRHPLDLVRIFVPQNARETIPAADISPMLLRQLREEGQIAREIGSRYPAQQRRVYDNPTISPILEILARKQLVVVLGGPGSGKTSLLKFIAMRWAEQQPGKGDSGELPIWIDLKEYVLERTGLINYVEAGLTGYGLAAGKVEKQLREGRAALYLDALDEIFDGPTRRSIIEEIAALAARYDHAPIVVTSRILGYEPERLSIAGFVHVTLEDFDQNQISAFLTKWYGAAEDVSHERVRLERKLLQAIHDTRPVRDLAGNPLLLTVMAVLNVGQDLPLHRAELYTQMARLMLHDWDARRSLGGGVLAWEEKAEFLRLLAGLMQEDGGFSENLIDRPRLIDLCRNFLSGMGVRDHYDRAVLLIKELTERNSILSYAGANRFSFVHRTFLEYFTAAWIVERFETKRQLTFQQLRDEVFGPHWMDESWHEVLLLIAAMINEMSVEKIIRFLMEQDGSDTEAANLMLAAGCLGEVRNRLAIQSTDQALWELFVAKATRWDAPPGRPPKKPYQLEPLRDHAARLIASVWGTTKGITWLRSAALDDPDPLLRTAAMEVLVLKWKDAPETLQIVKTLTRSDPDLLAQNAAIRALAREWKDDVEVLPLIRQLASLDRKTFVQRTAVQELARGWRDDPDTFRLLDTLSKRESNGYMRAAALEELARGWKDDPDIYKRLIGALGSDSDSYVRRFAVYAVAENWKDLPETVPVLIDLARSDAAEDVRGAAAGSLIRCWKTNAESLRVAREFIFSDSDERIRALMVRELAHRWKDDAETLPTVKMLIRSDISELVRMSAAYELVQGWMSDFL